MRAIVIGSGPAGLYASLTASRHSKVTLIEENEKLGGICVLYGCIPSKAMFHPVNLMGSLGKFRPKEVDLTELQEIGREAANRVSKGVEYLLESHGIEVISGVAKLGNGEVRVGTQSYPYDSVVVATGTSKPKVQGTVASDELPYIEFKGKRVIVIGGGAGGIEFAWFLSQVGAEVHVVESSNSLLQGNDLDISNAVKSNFIRKGIKLHLGLKAVKTEGGKVELSDGSILESDLTLFTFGRRPNVDGLGLELNGKYLRVDSRMKTSSEAVYGAGDVTGTFTAHEAIHQGIVAGANAVGEKWEYNESIVPKIIYSKPEIATIGKLEGKSVKVSYSSLPRAVADRETEGFLKIYYEGENIVGGAIYGERAEEIATIIGLVIQWKIRMEDLFRYHFPHPSYMELIWEAVGRVLGYLN
jgi:dihydrolipoamide dehydrogenase